MEKKTDQCKKIPPQKRTVCQRVKPLRSQPPFCCHWTESGGEFFFKLALTRSLPRWRYWYHHRTCCLATVIGESGFETRAGRIIVSSYCGICFEIKFSGRHRGFDSVLFNLWPLTVLVAAWTTDNRWPPAVCAGRSSMALFTCTAKLDPGCEMRMSYGRPSCIRY